MSITKAQSKYIRSLAQQKYRNEYKKYIVEGPKLALEWVSQKPSHIQFVVCLKEWAHANQSNLKVLNADQIKIVEPWLLESISQLNTPNQVLLVVDQLEYHYSYEAFDRSSIVLDHIQDPGNLGTILRIADWFGVHNIVASPDTVDYYNSKVVQAAMGAHLRLNLLVIDIVAYLKQQKGAVLVADMVGQSMYEFSKDSHPLFHLVISNEGNGVSAPIEALQFQKISIPKFGNGESLNAAVSCGILCAALCR